MKAHNRICTIGHVLWLVHSIFCLNLGIQWFRFGDGFSSSTLSLSLAMPVDLFVCVYIHVLVEFDGRQRDFVKRLNHRVIAWCQCISCMQFTHKSRPHADKFANRLQVSAFPIRKVGWMSKSDYWYAYHNPIFVDKSILLSRSILLYSFLCSASLSCMHILWFILSV